ncbi:right-handed parallel beta-helix repeat-containing protein [Aquimarina muelleri]|uniref:right-handed parallel beta-helix repeat-containing protein n=1 Tax=Aquimarina muelleri TaxID=279356 RepID=UPI003F683689
MTTIHVSVTGNDSSANQNYTNPSSPLKTINAALKKLAQFEKGTLNANEAALLSTPFTILLGKGVYREQVTIPGPHPRVLTSVFDGLTLTSDSDAGRCVISGADISTAPEFASGWDDIGGGLYMLKNWEYTFAPNSVEVIEESRAAFYREGSKNDFLTSYGIIAKILENFSERQVWVLPKLSNSPGYDISNPEVVPNLKPKKEMIQVFDRAKMSPRTFFVDYSVNYLNIEKCIEGAKQNPDNFDNYELIDENRSIQIIKVIKMEAIKKCLPHPNGGELYIKLDKEGLLFEDYAILISRRHTCIDVFANNVTIRGIGFRLGASPMLTAGANFEGNNISILNCNSTWHRGMGFSFRASTGVVNGGRIKECDSWYNGQEGMVVGNHCDSIIICKNRVNNNSLSYRYIDILPPTHANRIHLPVFSKGGLVLKSATNCTIVDHEAFANLGPGIWIDHGSGTRIYRGISRGNFGGGLSLEKTDNVEVFGLTASLNKGPGISLSSSDKCYIHHNYIHHNERAGIGLGNGVYSQQNILKTNWVLNNTIVRNLTGIIISGKVVAYFIGNHIVCSKTFGASVLNTEPQLHVESNNFYLNNEPSHDNNFNPDPASRPMFSPQTIEILLTPLNESFDPGFMNSCVDNYEVTSNSLSIGVGKWAQIKDTHSNDFPTELLYPIELSNCSAVDDFEFLPFKYMGAAQGI